MNSRLIRTIVQSIFILALQVLVLNHIELWGKATPYLYVCTFLFFPFFKNRWLFIFLSFVVGLIVDMFENTGGVHAAASVTIAFIRPILMQLSFGVSYEFQNVRFDQLSGFQLATYSVIAVLIHHVILFLLSYFNSSFILDILLQTLSCGVFTLVCIVFYTIFISRSKR